MNSKSLRVACFALVGLALQVEAAAPSNADILKAFPDLKSVTAPNAHTTIFYAPPLTTVLTGKAAVTEIWGGTETADRPIRTQLLGLGNGYFIVQCDPGPSGDSSCQFRRELPSGDSKEIPIKLAGSEREDTRLFGLRFVLPGNGVIYVDGHMDTTFNERRKFEWKDGSFVEVEQPFYFVGLDSTTVKHVILYSTRDFRIPVAQLPVGSTVTVLLNARGTEDYLLKTPFGLVGWAKIPPFQEADTIKGLYFAGD